MLPKEILKQFEFHKTQAGGRPESPRATSGACTVSNQIHVDEVKWTCLFTLQVHFKFK